MSKRERGRGERDEEGGGGVTELAQQLACIVTDLNRGVDRISDMGGQIILI